MLPFNTTFGFLFLWKRKIRTLAKDEDRFVLNRFVICENFADVSHNTQIMTHFWPIIKFHK